MPPADGFIKSTAGGRFSATFVIDEIMLTSPEGLHRASSAFTCNTATLEYPRLKPISSTRSFERRVGPSKVSPNLANGPAINGVLDKPLAPGSTVSGSGVWTHN